ncbi:hypothetical protein [Stenotrophomonas sp.]|uniref:SecDF P1 head subdomain-containing protein n=1 Tax=Stenotrophomonas sp. TaxID=69392 RepID=UPI00289C5F45|nr:hypothetical protein [Stenotrophomonas sp.]
MDLLNMDARMLRTLLAAAFLAAGGLTACTTPPASTLAGETGRGAAPLPHSRLLMREVDEQNLPASTRLTDAAGQPLSLLEPPFLVTADVRSVALDTDAYTGTPVLNVQLTEEAGARMLAATEARVGKRIAFTVGDRVLTVATIRGPFGKALQVNGLEDLEDAQQMYAEITGQHR